MIDKTCFKNFFDIPRDKNGYSSGHSVDEQRYVKSKYIPCLQFQRVVGYYSPLVMDMEGNPAQGNTWNPGKFEEFKERKTYSLQKAMEK